MFAGLRVDADRRRPRGLPPSLRLLQENPLHRSQDIKLDGRSHADFQRATAREKCVIGVCTFRISLTALTTFTNVKKNIATLVILVSKEDFMHG